MTLFSFGFGSAQPTAADNEPTQNDMSSQDGFSSATFKRLATTIVKINAAWVKNTTLDRGKATITKRPKRIFTSAVFNGVFYCYAISYINRLLFHFDKKLF